ncbi:PREDICTED: uncharacterized protein LOC108569116 [Nicrophorus vespilloides]|uniref:Uncharacterized protein LOC108569116 n=1 Tax=Nicrophorus vespilloides TaxID=110193 RepID=A0ABM1NGS8_NICVS|nr:PREDICTED: uncharacterized protein LOC108569116 [Nicrophorus vespilloides]
MDEETYFESILSSLRKPQNTKRLMQILIALRKAVNTPNHQARIQMIKRHNCIKPLVNYTRYDGNIKVVDLALSILGNCCMNNVIARLTINDLNILHNLNRVLEKHKTDSIEGRVFRILGNLCDGYQPWNLLKREPDVVKKVLQFLQGFEIEKIQTQRDNDEEESNDGITVPTISMALRFIRKMLVKDTFDQLANEHNLIKIVGGALIKCSNFWLQDNSNVVLINDVLKIVQILASSMFEHHDIIIELRNTADGNALNSFGDIILLNPERIVKIILKYAKLSKHQSDLPIELVITKLIDVVQLDGASTNKLYLSCVCRLMDHIGFHDKLKENINRLVELFKGFDLNNDYSIQCCTYICSILNKSKYNETLIKYQLAANIVDIIIDKLEVLTGKSTSKFMVVNHERRKSFSSYKNNKRFKRNELEDDKYLSSLYDAKSLDRCASPSSCSDISSCGPFSPAPSGHNICDDSDSDNYSPLCSENECDEDYKVLIPNDDLVMSDNEENKPSYNHDQVELRCRFRDEMSALLKIYCTLKPVCMQLGNPKLITVLINIVLDVSPVKGNCDNVLSVILSIANTREFLIPLMISGIIAQIYEIMETRHGSECRDCESIRVKVDDIMAKFLSVGHSESIRGDIAHMLLKTSKTDVKERLVLAIPYILRNNHTLNKLLLKCGGLTILMKLLGDKSNMSLQEETIKSVCALATDSLKIKNPVVKKSENDGPKIIVKAYRMENPCENLVKFKLEDGSFVEADRDEMNKISDYFSTLLSGSFMESGQTEINLKNVSKDSLSCLLQLLKLDVNFSVKDWGVFEFEYDLETVLEVILLTDRFLLPKLHYVLIAHMEQAICTSSVPSIYRWSIESGTNILRVESVAFALVGDISYKKRLEMFNSLFEIGYFLELLEDIEKLITQFL